MAVVSVPDLAVALNYDANHSFDALASIVNPAGSSYDSTRVGIVRMSYCTKPNPGVTALAIVFVASDVTNTCSGTARAAHCIETFFEAVALHWGL